MSGVISVKPVHMTHLILHLVFYSHKNITTLYFQKFELLSWAYKNCAS
jgi:hypothetical protein